MVDRSDCVCCRWQENILACAIDVMDKSANLIMEAKKAVNNPNNPDNQTRLAQVGFYFLFPHTPLMSSTSLSPQSRMRLVQHFVCVPPVIDSVLPFTPLIHSFHPPPTPRFALAFSTSLSILPDLWILHKVLCLLLSLALHPRVVCFIC